MKSTETKEGKNFLSEIKSIFPSFKSSLLQT